MQPTEAPVDGGYLPHRQILIVLGGLMAGMFLAALDQSIVGTALPRITSDLQGLDKLSWVVTAYLLTSTAATPLWGKISDLYGRRLIFQIAIIVFVAGSLLSGFSSSIEQLIAFRAVQGIGGGGLIALALATIGDIVPPRERGRYGGYMGAVFATSSVLGPVLGGWFADGPGWQWIFWINVPIGIVALVVTSAALKLHHVRREHAIDYLGAALVVGSVTSLLLYTAWAGPSDDYGWLSPYALGLISLALVLAVAFVLVERRVAEPIIPMELFANSVFSTANLYAFIIGIAMFGALIFLPLYLQVVAGMSPTRSGLAMLPIVAGLMTTSITYRTGHEPYRPLQGVPDHRFVPRRARPARPVGARRRQPVLACRGGHGAGRSRIGLRHADRCHGRTELRRPSSYGSRDQLGDVLPRSRRDLRHCVVRRDPQQPPRPPPHRRVR